MRSFLLHFREDHEHEGREKDGMRERTDEHELAVKCQAAGPSYIVDSKYFCIANLLVTFYVHFMFL